MKQGRRIPLMFFIALACVVSAVSAPYAQNLKAGRTFRDCPDCPEMVVISAGSFLMGSSEADTQRTLANVPPPPSGFSLAKLLDITDVAMAKKFLAYEHPQHLVTMRNDFAMGKYLVTTGEFATFVHETGYKTKSCDVLIGNHHFHSTGPAWQDPGFSVTSRDPVVCVDWYDAKAYIAWLNAKSDDGASGKADYPYRLPSEAEWEYAARAGTQTDRWWGNEIGVGNANCGGCRDTAVPPPTIVNGIPVYPPCCGQVQQRTTEVGSYPANPFGLYDMLGNVWEWTEDCWHRDYNGAPADGSAWGGGTCSERVTRGVDWHGTGTWSVRSATRTAFRQTDASNLIGFRVAKSLKRSSPERN